VSDIVIPVVETTTIENVRTAIEMAHDYKDITVIVGEPDRPLPLDSMKRRIHRRRW
jgi:hypothetical protein